MTMTAAVFDFKAIRAALPSVIEGGDNHYPVAQPMAVNTEITGQVVGESHMVGEFYADYSGSDVTSAEESARLAEFYAGSVTTAFTGSDGRAWSYNAYEDRWEHRPQDGSIVVSFVRPA
jgi:hypothetical protein